MSHLTNLGTVSAYRANRCECDTRDAACLPGDTIASVWECVECGSQVEFTDADYAFANSVRWVPGHARRFGFSAAARQAHLALYGK